MLRLLALLLMFSTPLLTAQQTVGVFVNDSTAYDGYVLFSNNEQTYLTDNCGRIVNQWTSDYKPGEAVYLLENGNLLRTAEIEGSGNFDAGGKGGRFELFSWEGELLWHYELATDELHTHHDIAPLPNGNFLATAWEKHSESDAQQNGRIGGGEVWSERIIEIKMVGDSEANIVWQWRVWNHLIQDHDSSLPNYGTVAEHPELIDLNYIDNSTADPANWIHLNAIDYDETLDQIAVSSRLFSEVWVIDHSTTIAEAATHSGGLYGKGGDLLYRYGNPEAYDRGTADDRLFYYQHDVRWIPSGYPYEHHLMVFNNGTEASPVSSVIAWMPPILSDGSYPISPNQAFEPTAVAWTYTAPDFYSRYMSSAQILPNGHLFICEGMSGHFFEVDEAHEMVWEYVNPVNPNGGPILQGGTVRFNQTFKAVKYGLDDPAFNDRTLEPSKPIELNPLESDCYQAALVTTPDELPNISIVENPVSNVLTVLSNLDNEAVIRLYDIKGALVLQVSTNGSETAIPVDHLENGIYFLTMTTTHHRQLPIHKILKFR